MTPLRADSRLISLIVATAFFMQMLDSSIMNTSLPQMAGSFGVAPLDLSIGITVYMLTAAAFVPVSGWLADRYGARRIFLGAIVIFSVASLFCGLAGNLWQFSAARAVQGLGGALMTPVGRMIVLRNTDKSQLLHATALITWPALAAPIIGPALGGFITTYLSWRWNFLLNVPLGLLGVWLVMRHVPVAQDANRQDLDWPGFVLTSGALIALLYGLERLSHLHSSWTSTDWLLSAGLCGLGVVLSLVSVRHLQRAARPLLELSAFAVQTYRMSTLTAGTAMRTAINATPFLLPLLFQVGWGLNALAAGGLLLVYFIGNLGVKPLTSPLLKRFGFRRVLVVNGCLGGLSIMMCAWLTAATPNWVTLLVLLLAGATRSMQFTALNTLAFADTSAAQRSSATTLFSMFTQVAGVLGVALATLVLNLWLLRADPALQQAQAGLQDIQLGFVVMGFIAIGASLICARLPADAGAEVSGNQA